MPGKHFVRRRANDMKRAGYDHQRIIYPVSPKGKIAPDALMGFTGKGIFISSAHNVCGAFADHRAPPCSDPTGHHPQDNRETPNKLVFSNSLGLRESKSGESGIL